jgi:outer membrane protein OmpA-like peptidoglycan-associated protein
LSLRRKSRALGTGLLFLGMIGGMAWYFHLRGTTARHEALQLREQGKRLEQQGNFREAAARYRAALLRDPKWAAGHLDLALSLVKAQEPSAYREALSQLRRFQESARSASAEEAKRLRIAQEWMADLEILVAAEASRFPESWTAAQLVEALSRPWRRGGSHYDGPRVPLRLEFRPGDDILSARARAQLREVCRALREGRLAHSRIGIEGHTDNHEEKKTGGDRRQLSYRRAEAVRGFLIHTCGLASDRLEIIGYGDDFPLAANANPGGRAQNRRVELINLDEREPILSDVRDQK